MNDDGLLRHVKIARPCPVTWDELSGDEKSRHCRRCQLSVLNLETAAQEDFVDAVLRAAAGERVCVGVSSGRSDERARIEIDSASSDRESEELLLGFPRVSSRIARTALLSLSAKSRRTAAWIAGVTTFLLSLPASAQSSESAEPVAAGTAQKPRLHSTISETASAPVASETAKQTAAEPTTPKDEYYRRPELMGDVEWQRYAQHPLLKPEVDKLQSLSATRGKASAEVAAQLEAIMRLFEKLQNGHGGLYYYDQIGQLAEGAVDTYESKGDYASALKVCEEHLEFEKKLKNPAAGIRYWSWRADRCKRLLGSSKPAQ